MVLAGPGIECFGAQDLRWGIDLAILDVATVAARKDGHLVVARRLAQVMIYVAGGIEVVGYYDVRIFAGFQACEEECRGASAQPCESYPPRLLVFEQGFQGLLAGRGGKQLVGFIQVHSRGL